MLEAYFDIVLIIISLIMAYLLGEHYGENRYLNNYVLKQALKSLEAKGDAQKLTPSNISRDKLEVPRPPLPSFPEQSQEKPKKIKADEYLGV